LFIIVYFLFCVCVLRRTIYNNDNIINMSQRCWMLLRRALP